MTEFPNAFEESCPRLERTALTVILLLTILKVAVAAHAGLSADEAYYWQWTQNLQLSYYDHPAMVAYWIWAGVHLLGQTALGVRLPAVGASLITTALIWDIARLAFKSRRAAAWAALWLNCGLIFAVAGVIVTPDTPLLVFWSLALWGMVRLIAEQRSRWLFVMAIGLGLGAISKYTILLLVPGLVVTALLFPELRRWLTRWQTWAAALLALACTAPLWIWNIEHDFASFHKQLGHAMTAETNVKPLSNLGTFLGGQIGLVTPLIFGFCLWGMGVALWRGWREKRPEWLLLGAASLPILLFFTEHSLKGLVQPHWDGPAYLAGLTAAAGFGCRLSGKWKGLFKAAPLLSLAMTLLLFFQAGTALLPLPVKIDALKRLGGWDELAAAVAEERAAHPEVFLFTEKHEPTGPLSFLLKDHPPVFQQGYIRPSYYSAEDVAALRGRNTILITQAGSGEVPYASKHFSRFTLLRSVTLHWGGRPFATYELYLGEGYKGGIFTMGDGWRGLKDDWENLG